MSKPALYFHTLRHLRPIQIAARAWRGVQRPHADGRPAPMQRRLAAPYASPVAPPPSLVARDVFRFLNVQRCCASAADWQAADAARLWRYHLHYFADLNAVDSPARTHWHRALLERWVAENPPGAGAGWEPYPLSLRMVNWVKWSARGNPLPPACHTSLAVQARWLAAHLEYHLLGNHLLANAKALLHTGLYFEGPEAQRWYERGLRILNQQLGEQVLQDGGHFELSTMYHALVLEDLLDLINLLRAHGREPPAAWLRAALMMRAWLRQMSHPDGEIAFFNDAALDGAASAAELEAYAMRLALPAPVADAEVLSVLAASGYLRANVGPASLFCDCAPVGPDYLPAHGHADTLAFELSLAGRRLFVNSGVSEYAEGPERQRQRGTAAHNTVVVDGENSSEVWGAFRVARRARAQLHAALPGPPTVIEGGHDGYRRLPGRNLHTRRWTLARDSLCIEDRISGTFARAEARLHVHPAVEVRTDRAGRLILQCGSEELARLEFEHAADVEVARGTWHPRFGVSESNSSISARFSGQSLTTRVQWRQGP